MRRKLFFLIAVLFTSVVNVFAQAEQNWLDDTFFQDGKYRVVVVVLSIIFLGLMVMIAMIERRVSKLEKLNNKKTNEIA